MQHRPFVASIRLPLLASLAAATILEAGIAAAETWVITDQSHPTVGDADRHVLLDAPTRLEIELASGLPSDPEQATAVVQHRLKQGGTDLQHRIAATYQGVADAWSLGITKVPAAVLDRRYVVYGDTDVERAVARIEQHKRERP
ncbi:MAG: TIGR03757 family integrating conjugative element protein [Rhodocyclaceae bacterium]|nr:TIGR03757 family integrating conjugative element protein [Rhodocyclaceae bacterium]